MRSIEPEILAVERGGIEDCQGTDLECDPSNLAAAGPKLAAPLLKRCLWLRVGGHQIRNLTQRISAVARPHQLFSRLCLRQALMKNTAA